MLFKPSDDKHNEISDPISSQNEQTPSHYIGIGASAGGLEALEEFFSYLPNNIGAAFVVAQHLSPDFKSMMPELLSKHTSMPIYQANDGVRLKKNTVYLMPPRKNMLITEGRLQISEQMPDENVHMPIDIFLRSLAEDQQHQAIGIVLSGTGSDGTRGVKALKESGGLVIVQEPSSAKFNGMPISAYNTGLADLLLQPRDMGENLVQFIKHPSISGKGSALKKSIPEDGNILNEIFKILESQSSINFSQYKASTVARRIERRIGLNQLNNLEAYLRLLLESPRELQILSKDLLIGVTRFFRDDEAFSLLTQAVIPKIIDECHAKRKDVRFWVAGCSSGEEAYSLAIIADEYIKQKKLDINIKIFATDVDEDAIAEASVGDFSPEIIQDISTERLEKYFTEKEKNYEILPSIRQMVIFAAHNMIDDPPFSNIDLVSCRNVLIYFQHAAQKKVLSSLYFSLRRDGYLFLGSSELLGDLKSHFETVEERSKIYRKISNMHIPIGNMPPLNDSLLGHSSMTMVPVSSSIKINRLSLTNQLTPVLERLIAEYAPDCIVLNEMFDAVHVYGDVSFYTKGVIAGKISNNIKDMVVDDLNVAISTALFRCEKNEDDVFYKDVMLNISKTEQVLIDLSIFCIKGSEISNAPKFYAVQFIRYENSEGQERLPKKITFDATEQSKQRIYDLEQELIKKQEHLQVTIEELETTNEELQSANEELMSANEELQSTNEELQSVNEELYTVNSEYQEKIVELTESNSDLDSVMNSTDIGIIFLDEQLSIRKYTPWVAKYVNVRHSDIGRPFHHISHELVYSEFLADIAKVSGDGQVVEKDIVSAQDHSLLVRILPYHKSQNSTQMGVLITLTNISRLKFVESALQRAQDQLRSSLLNRSERLHKRIVKNDDVKVLLLDDDIFDRKRVKKLLSAVNDRAFNVMACAEIDEAVEFASKNSIDICLVDYNLAGGTAKDFTEKMRYANIDTPVVILSGYSETGLDTDFLNTDIFDFLNKDELSSQLLARSIDYVLERKDVKEALSTLS